MVKFDNIIKGVIPSPDGDEKKTILFGLACNISVKEAVKRVIEELQKQEIS